MNFLPQKKGEKKMAKAGKNSITQLRQEVLACTLCEPVLPHSPRPIVQIDKRARILIAGQAPGRHVHETGIPFDDRSGDRLREWMGIDGKTFYDPTKIAILPMGFCFPGTGPSGDLPPRPECAQTWRRDLLASLPNIQLTLVIGQYAHAYHLSDSSHTTVTEAVKAWKEFWPDQLPLPHPSPRNNLWLKRNPWFTGEVVLALQRRVKKLLGS